LAQLSGVGFLKKKCKFYAPGGTIFNPAQSNPIRVDAAKYGTLQHPCGAFLLFISITLEIFTILLELSGKVKRQYLRPLENF
jgi:hypothetical protein